MGIWLELGIFVLVLVWGVWQIRDARQAHAKSVAERKAREAAEASAQAPSKADNAVGPRDIDSQG
jgi:heme exporter protein D